MRAESTGGGNRACLANGRSVLHPRRRIRRSRLVLRYLVNATRVNAVNGEGLYCIQYVKKNLTAGIPYSYPEGKIQMSVVTRLYVVRFGV